MEVAHDRPHRGHPTDALPFLLLRMWWSMYLSQSNPAPTALLSTSYIQACGTIIPLGINLNEVTWLREDGIRLENDRQSRTVARSGGDLLMLDCVARTAVRNHCLVVRIEYPKRAGVQFARQNLLHAVGSELLLRSCLKAELTCW